MNDTVMSVIAIFLGAILMFIFPLMATADRSDDISQQAVQTATTEFVDEVRSTGKLTLDDYNAFVSTISATGHTYNVQLEASILDENSKKKTQQVDSLKVGTGSYVKQFDSQIMETLETKSATNTYSFKQGDIFSVTVTNKDRTIAQVLKEFAYRIAGNDTYSIAAKHSGIVNVNG